MEAKTNVPLTTVGKKLLEVSREDWLWAFAFLLSMSLTGLNFPLGYVAVIVILVNRFMKNRYDFIIQLTLLFGGYALASASDFPFKLEDAAFVVSLAGVFLYRKTPMMKRITTALLLYALIILLIAKTSDETMMIQFRRIRLYLMIFYVFIPLMAFSGRAFGMQYFFRKILAYTLVICVFYALDGFVLHGFILIPDGWAGEGVEPSTFTNPYFYPFPRKYPPGLYIAALCVIPITRYYKLNGKQWFVVAMAFASTRTLSVIGALLISFGIFQGYVRRMLKYAALGIVGITVMYHVDSAMGGFLRIQSTIDQFIALDVVQDEEDLSEFGSGRMAQIIPKMELLYDLDREWLGLGFLHPELTTNPKFLLKNELYTDVTKADEVATGVEVSVIQTILDMGYIGLFVQMTFYFYLYYIIRKLKYSVFYLSVLVVNIIFGIGGFAGLNSPHGLLLLALTYSAVLLSNKDNPLYSGRVGVQKKWEGEDENSPHTV